MRPLFLLALAGLSSVLLGNTSYGNAEPAGQPPVLTNTCLITGKFTRLVDFYSHVLGIPPRVSNGVYAEFPTGAGVLAIFAADTQEKYIPGSARPASNRSVILEFKVGDVDAEFNRLHGLVKSWVKSPTNQPWGTRSFYFRDPDGNLVDFYRPANVQ